MKTTLILLLGWQGQQAPSEFYSANLTTIYLP